MRKRIIKYLLEKTRRVIAGLRRVPSRVRVFIASLHIPARVRRIRDDVKYLLLGRYIPASYAALLAYEHTEYNEIGRFVYDFCDGNGDRITQYYVHWMICDGIVYGRGAPSRIWATVGTRGNIRILPDENSFITRHAIPRRTKNLRVSRHDFAAYIKSLDRMVRP